MSHQPGGAKREKLAHYEEAAQPLEVSLDPLNMTKGRKHRAHCGYELAFSCVTRCKKELLLEVLSLEAMSRRYQSSKHWRASLVELSFFARYILCCTKWLTKIIESIYRDI